MLADLNYKFRVLKNSASRIPRNVYPHQGGGRIRYSIRESCMHVQAATGSSSRFLRYYKERLCVVRPYTAPGFREIYGCSFVSFSSSLDFDSRMRNFTPESNL